MIAHRAWAAALAASMALAAVPSSARAEDAAAEAHAHYDKGIQLYEEGAFDAALVEFERAYELNPSWRIFYNIALIHQQLNDYAAALQTFERYLADGGADVAPERRAEVQKLMEDLRTRVATLVITVDRPGADVTIDDRPIGKSPLSGSVTVNAGHHRISATIDGRTATKLVTVAALESARIELDVGTPPTTRDLAPATTVPPPKIPWIAWGATAALTTGALVTGVLALRASSQLADDRRTDGVSRSTLDTQHDKTRTLALVTDVLVGGALVMGGVSLYLTLAQPTASPDAPKTAIAPTIRLGVGAGSLRVLGEF